MTGPEFGRCGWHGCDRRASVVLACFQGWLHEVCERCAVAVVAWPPVAPDAKRVYTRVVSETAVRTLAVYLVGGPAAVAKPA